MPITGIELLTTIFMILFLLLYFYAFYTIILKKDVKYQFIQRFYKAVVSVYMLIIPSSWDKNGSTYLTYTYEQLNLNYEKLCQSIPNNKYSSILDALETVIYYYDSFSDNMFKKIFKLEKNKGIRTFMSGLCLYIKQKILSFLFRKKKLTYCKLY